jgi:hypothetical protein
MIDLVLRIIEKGVVDTDVGMLVCWSDPPDLAALKSSPSVAISELELAALTRWDRLGEFLASDRVIGVRLCWEPTEPGVLQDLIESGAPLSTFSPPCEFASELPKRERVTIVGRRQRPKVWRSVSKKAKQHGKRADAR